MSVPRPKIKGEDLAFIVNELNEGIKQFMLAEANILKSGVIEKDGTLWANMN